MSPDANDLPRWMEILVLVAIANAAPWCAGRLLKHRWAAPLDGGFTLTDGTRALGDHKTWRGLLTGTLSCAVAAQWMGYTFTLGFAFGLLSLVADSATSFAKRRWRLKPGTEVLVVDQLPETLVPIAILAAPLGVSMREAAAISVVFLILGLAFTRLRHRGE